MEYDGKLVECRNLEVKEKAVTQEERENPVPTDRSLWLPETDKPAPKHVHWSSSEEDTEDFWEETERVANIYSKASQIQYGKQRKLSEIEIYEEIERNCDVCLDDLRKVPKPKRNKMSKIS